MTTVQAISQDRILFSTFFRHIFCEQKLSLKLSFQNAVELNNEASSFAVVEWLCPKLAWRAEHRFF
jgi:hypothetical protein